MDIHHIAGGGLTASIKADGAELCALGLDGQDVLWPAHAPWPRHAPVLFPIIGRLKNDTLRHGGREYRLTQHGFARDRRFAWDAATATECRLVLTDDDATRALYPFAFRFEVAYAIIEDALVVTFRVTNTGDVVLPASMGAHPAFRWPLEPGIAKETHSLVFSADETAPTHRVAGGLLVGETFPSVIHGRVLHLAPELFATDAIILDPPASQSVRYGAPGTPEVEVSWSGFPQLGIWSRADADLLCIEPWHGYASPADFDGDFIDKPGLMLLPPGESRHAEHRVRIARP